MLLAFHNKWKYAADAAAADAAAADAAAADAQNQYAYNAGQQLVQFMKEAPVGKR